MRKEEKMKLKKKKNTQTVDTKTIAGHCSNLPSTATPPSMPKIECPSLQSNS